MFLKYLMDKKLIDSEQALSVAIEYLASRPSLLKIIKSEGILESSKVMDIYFKAGAENKSFYEVFVRDAGLTPDDLHQLVKTQNMGGKSFGHIIVEKGVMAQDKWESALRDYLKSDYYKSTQLSEPVESKSTDADSRSKEKTNEQVPCATAGISAAALESLKEVSGLDADQLSQLEAQVEGTESSNAPSEQAAAEMMALQMDSAEDDNEVENELKSLESNAVSDSVNDVYRDEYFNTHNEELQSEVLVIANRYRLKKREKDLSLFHQNMSKILSLAKLSDFKFIEKLLTPYDSLMNQMMDDANINPENWDELVSDMLDLLWNFRTHLFEGKPEKDVIADNEVKKRYIENIKSIMAYIKR